MLRKFLYPHSLIVTVLIFVLIWFLDSIRVNFHFLNPFKKTLRDYEITDIVYSRLRDKTVHLDNRIVLVNSGIPPNRDTMRMVIDRIVDAEAKVIAIDITLEEQKNPHTDSLLRQSLLRLDNLVLANKLDELGEDGNVFITQTSCDTFFSNYLSTGYINFIDNDSSTIRYFSPREFTPEERCLSFAVRTAFMYDSSAVHHLFNRNKNVEEIYYTGDEYQFIRLSIRDILEDNSNLKSIIKDKIVLIGFIPIDDTEKISIDKHYTPLNNRYTGHNVPDMYGIAIHANIIQMILNKTYINELSFIINALLTFIFCYINVHLFYKIHRRVSVPYQFITRFLQIGEIILLFFVVAFLFHSYRIKLDVMYWITALLLTFDAVKFYDNFGRKRIAMLERIPFELPAPVRKAKSKSPAKK